MNIFITMLPFQRRFEMKKHTFRYLFYTIQLSRIKYCSRVTSTDSQGSVLYTRDKAIRPQEAIGWLISVGQTSTAG